MVVGADRIGERLIEAVVGRGNAGEPASVERDADDELVARHPLVEEGTMVPTTLLKRFQSRSLGSSLDSANGALKLVTLLR